MAQHDSRRVAARYRRLWTVLDRTFEISFDDPTIRTWIDTAFASFDEHHSGVRRPPSHRIRIVREPEQFRVLRGLKTIGLAADSGELLFLLQQETVVELQRLRSDLLFIHSAVLEYIGRALLLIGPSGGGKSTLSWALLHRGLRYLSDELAPIDPANLVVHRYPQALNLKSLPPDPFQLPRQTLTTGRARYVPVDALPAGLGPESCPIQAIFLVQYAPSNTQPGLDRLTPAEAVAHIYPNVLNALAHEAQGLDALIALTGRLPCYRLASARLTETTDLVIRTLTHL